MVDVSDRIFSTSVDCSYKYTLPTVDLASGSMFEAVFQSVLATTLEIFATHNSKSVQATLYIMASKILHDNQLVAEVTYKLPNKVSSRRFECKLFEIWTET